jgi:hypothetical protein
MWKNVAKSNVPQMTIWRIHSACWTPKATNTHTQIVSYILIFYCNSGYTKMPQCCFIRNFFILLFYGQWYLVIKIVIRIMHDTKFNKVTR